MGQVGKVALPIQWRYLAKGTWPVRSCEMRLAVLLGSSEMSLMYSGFGGRGSVCFIQLKRLERVQMCWILSWVWVL